MHPVMNLSRSGDMNSHLRAIALRLDRSPDQVLLQGEVGFCQKLYAKGRCQSEIPL
ncbi:MAG: hypothetical protein HY785_03260 [Oscillatoriophycideae cyanobacterium NC_groundwater_1537_Pr4_S-0.65um_50_18]|nr:hypothetical protein [Oscillatoriophycideae cyanobacterium NC_groundwater_1537_Pr4_S-0.65um_50_18]